MPTIGRPPGPGPVPVPTRTNRAAPEPARAASPAAPPVQGSRGAFASGTPVAAVDLQGGALVVGGRRTFLYGADLHYFRVRDPGGDVAKTRAAWAHTLDEMKRAGCNHVTTYVPWDVHATAPGRYDFSGERDLRAFLQLAKDRGMHVILKPGPLITGEWPAGFGSFGAVPAWWKDANPGSLDRKPDGQPYSFHPLGRADQRQPAMLDPAYLRSVEAWYARFVEEVRPFLGDPVIGLQLDNETNGYWADRLGGPGYSPSSVEHWRGFLRTRYESIEQLNAAWGTRLRSFDEATPPTRAFLGQVPKGDEARVRDWYDGGKALVRDYLGSLRTMLERQGVGGLLLTTNDSPFAVNVLGVPVNNAVLLPDGGKNEVAVNVLDLYPSLSGSKRAPHNEPFQTDFFVRLFDRRADRATGEQGWMYGAELQGGMFGVGPFRPNVPVEATDTMLLRAVAGGLKGGSLYVVRDGLNADGSRYDYGAPLDAEGRPTPRYEVMARWGHFLERQGDALTRAEPVRNRVAVVVDGRDAAPTADGENRQRLRAVEDPALYGWLAAAGFAVDVVDLEDLGRDGSRYRAVLMQTPSPLSQDEQRRLSASVDDGGAVVTFLAAPEGAPLPPDGTWHWPNLTRSGDFNASLPGFSGRLRSAWNARFLDARQAPDGVEVIARERPLLGSEGRALGYVDRRGRVQHAHVGTNLYNRFGTEGFYTDAPASIAAAAGFARSLLQLAGERPVVDTGNPRVLCTPRRAPDRLFLFVENAQPEATTASVRLRAEDAAATFGLEPARRYRLRDDLNGVDLGERTGAELLAGGLKLELGPMGTAAVVVTPAPSP